MGRHVAGESFLTGYLRYSTADTIWIKSEYQHHRDHFSAFSKSIGCDRPVRFIGTDIATLAEPGLIFYPGPGIGEYANHRSFFGHDQWSLCGINHTTSSALAMDAMCNLVNDPVFPWDSVICTSSAVKANVVRLMELQRDYMRERFGGGNPPELQLPVIPLGIDTGKFSPSPDRRNVARAALDIDEDTIVVLFAGRLSFHAKAHPLAMYLALEKTVQRTGKKILLIESGRFASESIEKSFQEAAAEACPSVIVQHLDGREPEGWMHAWMGADIFCSLSDCTQEAFGITPVEAMAAGLPVVVSDWDGYKDTVENGVQGFRVPTVQPPIDVSLDLAYRHATGIDSYDRYSGYTGALVAVDIDAAADAFAKLVDSTELRKKMGAAGRKRALEIYDWKVIIPLYEELWASLQEKRRQLAPTQPGIQRKWPARSDPFDIFSGYPTFALDQNHYVRLAVDDPRAHLAMVLSLSMVNFAESVIPELNECQYILGRLSDGKLQVSDFLPQFSIDRQPFILRSVAWMAKVGLVSISPTR